MSMPPPPDPGYPAPPWNRAPAGLGGPFPGPPPQGWYPSPEGYHPPPRGTNGFAIAALVFGIIGGALLGFIFGFVALSQIKRSGQGGRGMAIAGLVLSGVWVLIVGGLIALAVATSAQRDTSTGQVASSGTVSSRDLRPGDCLNNLRDSTDLRSLPAVPCAQPHEGEVFAVFDLPSGAYPGQSQVDSLSESGCGTRFGGYSSSDPNNERLFVVYPLESNWTRGDREVACIATPLDSGLTTGSLKTD